MGTRSSLPIVAALLLAVSACAGPQQPSEPASAPATTRPSGAAQPSGDARPSATEQPSESAAPTPTAAPVSNEGTVSITLNGTAKDFTPDLVKCDGSGSVRHVVAKQGHGLPIIEWTPGRFAMVKLDNRSAPEKTTSPSGIEAVNGKVTFTKAAIGNAVVHGTLVCQ